MVLHTVATIIAIDTTIAGGGISNERHMRTTPIAGTGTGDIHIEILIGITAFIPRYNA